MNAVVRLSRIGRLAPPSQRLIEGQDLRGFLRPSHPAKWGVREGPTRFLRLPRHRFQFRLSCCRGSQEGFFANPQFCWVKIVARRFRFLGRQRWFVELEVKPLRTFPWLILAAIFSLSRTRRDQFALHSSNPTIITSKEAAPMIFLWEIASSLYCHLTR